MGSSLRCVKMAKVKKNKVAFTLAELSVMIIVLSLVAIIVTKESVAVTQKKLDAEKVVSTYELMEKAALAWQAEKDCRDDIKICIKDERAKVVKSSLVFNQIAKYLPVQDATVDLNAKSRNVVATDVSKVDWLPPETRTLAKEPQSDSTMGVSSFYDKNSSNVAHYKLKNGTTISAYFPNDGTNTGYGFFDINGKEGANTIGVDVFPFGIGADIQESNPLYYKAAKGFNPYFVAKDIVSSDMCNVNFEICSDEKMSSNPTAYVLKWQKLPK